MNNEPRPTDSAGWHPIGPRRVELSPCASCSGVGTIVTHEIAPCDRCSGQGFVASGDEALKLCGKCRGVRTVALSRSAPCSACSGKGTSPVIEQTFAGDIVCPDCNGRGTYESTEESEPDECGACDGKGYRTDDAEDFAQEEWMATSERPTLREPTRWNAINEPVEWKTETLEFVSITDCNRCQPNQLEDCSFCRGTRRVVTVAQPCDYCHGEGEVRQVYYTPCDACGGRGTIRVTESRIV